MREWELVADNLSKAGWSLGCINGETRRPTQRWPSQKRDSKFPKAERLLYAVHVIGIAQSFLDEQLMIAAILWHG